MTRTTRETTLTTVRGLALASHAGPTVVVTVLAGFFAAGVGSGATTTALVVAAVLTGQLSVGWSNDWLDAR
ncbi:MAG: ubiquinone biosynthesis protein UbiA, partial [Oerskovia sp.]|nr:ubiquinone biosynthesis protein UbiA [Oerskovia sp.]